MDSGVHTPRRVRLRPIALPTEHGGWSLLLEPALLGLLLAPSAAGGLLGLAALGAFLARQPLHLALADRRRGKRYPRTGWAEGFSVAYGGGALLAFSAALALAQAPFWPALALGIPLAAVQVAYDLRRDSRALPAELAGAAALAGLAPAMLLASGWTQLAALVVWALLVSRALPAILYVRVRLRRARGEAAPAWPAMLAHLAGLALAAGLVLVRLAPWTALAAVALLLGRAAYGLRPQLRPLRAALVGVQEVVAGLVTVGLLAAGWIAA